MSRSSQSGSTSGYSSMLYRLTLDWWRTESSDVLGWGGFSAADVELLDQRTLLSATANDDSYVTNEDTSATGTLTASGFVTAPPTSYQIVTGPSHGVLTQGVNGAFEYTPTANYFGADSFTFRATNGTETSTVGTISLTVFSVNDVPQVVAGQTFSAPANGTFNGTIVASDPDGGYLEVYTIVGAAHGTLNVNANGTFEYTPNAGFLGADQFIVNAFDGNTSGTPQVVTVQVTAANASPTANSQSVALTEDTVYDGVLTGSDPEGSPLTYEVVGLPQRGTLVLNANGSFRYTPDANFSGADFFTFRVNDGTSASVPATVSLAVAPVNDAPVMGNSTTLTTRNRAVTGTVAGTDADGNTLTYAVASGPANGLLALNANGSYTYTPTTNFVGTDSFRVRANDGALSSNEATVTITVAQSNVAPVVQTLSLSTDEDTAVTGQLGATDGDGDAVTWRVVTLPTRGTVVVGANGAVLYTPGLNASGDESFAVVANDGFVDSAVATVNVSVAAVNDAPTGNVLTVTTDRNVAVSGTVSGADIEGVVLTYAIETLPLNGSVVFNANGSFSYTPDPDYAGADQFTFQASDGQLLSAPTTVFITVTATNRPPVVVSPVEFSTTEDQAFAASISGVDPDGDAVTYRVVASPVRGALQFNANGTFTYTPSPNANGADQFTVVANDGLADSAPVVVRVTVAAVNDIPVALDRAYTTSRNVSLAGSFAGTDEDFGGVTELLIVSITNPANGTVAEIPGTNSFVYTPNTNFTGQDQFTFRVSDGQSTSLNVGVITINVEATNQAPVIANQTFRTAPGAALNGTVVGTDGDGDALTYSTVVSTSNGTLTLNANGTFRYVPAVGFVGTDRFVVQASDGITSSNAAEISILVSTPNRAPRAMNQVVTTLEDTAVAGVLSVSDPDGNPLTYSLVLAPSRGSVMLRSDGTFEYTPNANYAGNDRFVYVANDGLVNSNHGSVSIVVTPVNDAPVGTARTYTTTEDRRLNAALPFVDPDRNPITYTVVTPPSFGTMTLNLNSTFTYTPFANRIGQDQVVIVGSDGLLSSEPIVLTIQVTPVNDRPVARSIVVEVPEDGSVTGLLPITDADGDALTYRVDLNPSRGGVVLNGDGTFTYTPRANYVGNDRFTVEAFDGQLYSNLASISLRVLPVNDAPTANSATYNAVGGRQLRGRVTGVDVDRDVLTYALVTPPAVGTLTVNADGTFAFWAPTTYAGTVQATYQVSDGVLSATGTLTIQVVAGTNRAPVMAAQSFTGPERQPLEGALVATDADQDSLMFSVVSGPTYGTVTMNPDGSFRYVVTYGYVGTDTFVARVTDGQGSVNALITLETTSTSFVRNRIVYSRAAEGTTQTVSVSNSGIEEILGYEGRRRLVIRSAILPATAFVVQPISGEDPLDRFIWQFDGTSSFGDRVEIEFFVDEISTVGPPRILRQYRLTWVFNFGFPNL